MYSTGPDEETRKKLGLVSRDAKTKSVAFALIKLAAPVAILVLAYGWHQERDIADKEKARAEVAERRLAVCTGCAQSWAEYRDETNHRRK